MNNKEGNERKKQIHLERNFVNVKQYALIHKTSHTSQKKHCHIKHWLNQKMINY